LKTKKHNIGTKEAPKMAIIGDYWDQEIVTQVVDLLKEYEDLFPRSFLEMKGIAGSLREMKIQLKLDAKLKEETISTEPKYKEKVHKELDQMLEVGIIVPVEESDWIIPMVVQPKKMGDLRICVDLHNLNATCIHDPFPTPFTDEVLENVGGHESLLIHRWIFRLSPGVIMEEDRAKTTFVT
jgi:hypothetical protein